MSVVGKVWKYGDNINTDIISPPAYMELSTEEAAVPYKSDYVEKLMIGWKLTGQIVEKSQADGNVLNADQYYLDFDEDGKPYMQRIQQAQHEIDEYI